jgi:hypothetical protein
MKSNLNGFDCTLRFERIKEFKAPFNLDGLIYCESEPPQEVGEYDHDLHPRQVLTYAVSPPSRKRNVDEPLVVGAFNGVTLQPPPPPELLGIFVIGFL